MIPKHSRDITPERRMCQKKSVTNCFIILPDVTLLSPHEAFFLTQQFMLLVMAVELRTCQSFENISSTSLLVTVTHVCC